MVLAAQKPSSQMPTFYGIVVANSSTPQSFAAAFCPQNSDPKDNGIWFRPINNISSNLKLGSEVEFPEGFPLVGGYPLFEINQQGL